MLGPTDDIQFSAKSNLPISTIFWIHIKCNNFNKNDYVFNKIILICINSIAQNVAFLKLNNIEFYFSVKKGVLNSNNKEINFVSTNFQQQITNKLNSEINNNVFDLDTENEDIEDEVIPTIDSKYYSIDDCSTPQFSPTKTFSVFRYNIHSIERHIEEFRATLQMIDFKFEIICISDRHCAQGKY